MSSKKVKLPQQELLNTQNNVEESLPSQQSSEMAEMDVIEGTPFTVVGNEERGYFIAIGKFRISEVKPTREEAECLLSTDRWNVIVNLIVTLAGEMDNFNDAVTVKKG